MSLTLNENSEVQCVECSDTIDIPDRILFVFYPGPLLLYTIRCMHYRSMLEVQIQMVVEQKH